MILNRELLRLNCLLVLLLVLNEHLPSLYCQNWHKRFRREPSDEGQNAYGSNRYEGRRQRRRFIDDGSKSKYEPTRHRTKYSRDVSDLKVKELPKAMKSWFSKELRHLKRYVVPLPLQNKTVAGRRSKSHRVLPKTDTRGYREPDYEAIRGDYDDRSDRAPGYYYVQENGADDDEREDRGLGDLFGGGGGTIATTTTTSSSESNSAVKKKHKRANVHRLLKQDTENEKKIKDHRKELLKKRGRGRSKVDEQAPEQRLKEHPTKRHRVVHVSTLQNMVEVSPGSSNRSDMSSAQYGLAQERNLQKLLEEMKNLLTLIEKDLNGMGHAKLNSAMYQRDEKSTESIKDKIKLVRRDRLSAIVSISIIILIMILTVGATLIFVVKPKWKKKADTKAVASHFAFSD